jgi:hypothetical protein
MPNMMSMTYGMEIQQTKDRITIYGELNDVYRRIYLDGRKPSPKVLDDPTFAGYSTGHWEGDTLVVDTVAIRGMTCSFVLCTAISSPCERTGGVAGRPEDQITDTDQKLSSNPSPGACVSGVAGNDELREFSCARTGLHEVGPKIIPTPAVAPAATAQEEATRSRDQASPPVRPAHSRAVSRDPGIRVHLTIELRHQDERHAPA